MKPIMHGGDHREGGPDPTPLSSAWILASGTGSGGAGTAVEVTVDLTSWAMDAFDNFDVELGTGGFSAIHGIRIIAPGFYRVWWDVLLASGTNGDVFAAGAANTPGVHSSMLMSNNQNVGDHVTLSATAKRIQFAQLFFVGGTIGSGFADPPQFMFPSVKTVGASSAYTVDIAVLIERLTKTYTTNLSAGSAP